MLTSRMILFTFFYVYPPTIIFTRCLPNAIAPEAATNFAWTVRQISGLVDWTVHIWQEMIEYM